MSSQQVWNPRQYAEHARFVTDLGAPLIELLAPKAGERILDLGCGDGVLTKHLMDRPLHTNFLPLANDNLRHRHEHVMGHIHGQG